MRSGFRNGKFLGNKMHILNLLQLQPPIWPRNFMSLMSKPQLQLSALAAYQAVVSRAGIKTGQKY
ncbi:hypothetical protein CS542_08345 [Pedobacter sp. IW39]|nr:hypothetical protein CS542_08345 [Pedobacter sp. IW39]